MSSTDFKVARCLNSPNQSLTGTLLDSPKDTPDQQQHRTESSRLPQTEEQSPSWGSWCLHWGCSDLPSLYQHNHPLLLLLLPGNSRCSWVRLCCPLPSSSRFLSEMWFSALPVRAPAAGISRLEEWQNRLFAPPSTFPSLQWCPCSGRPANGNWTAPAAQSFSPPCSRSQQGQAVQGRAPECLGRAGDPG